MTARTLAWANVWTCCRRAASALTVLVCAACAAPGDVATPGAQVVKDDYDGAISVLQPAAVAGDYTGDWNQLGFEWRAKFPNRVVLDAGTRGVVNVTGLELVADGEAVETRLASERTDYGTPGPERWSVRRFETTWTDFERLAAARNVQMKVIGANEVLVTTFGLARRGAPVNETLARFRASVRKLRGDAAPASRQ